MWYQVPKHEPQPQKLKQIFPWESKAPKPTRVFPQAKAPSPPPTEYEPHATAPADQEYVTTPSTATDTSDATEESAPTPVAPPIDPWAAFESRTNAWDDMPEIERYVQAFSQARKGKLQVLHHTPSQYSPRGSTVTSPPAENEKRRPSMKLTDFPTEIERPSLPVTPAPIRRPSFWGEERDDVGNLPAAEGVPKQEDWVRRFSSYSQPVFPDLPPPLHNLLHGIFYWRCQFCGKQNPVSKLEELQRRQSEVLVSPTETRKLEEDGQELPQRKMPDSKTKEEAIEAAIHAISPIKTTKAPKPILKEPKFELGKEEGEPDWPEVGPDDDEEQEADSPRTPRFNPLTMVGEAATESRQSAKSAPEVAAVGS